MSEDETPRGEFDPLARLYKARLRLHERGRQGEYVIPDLVDVNRAINQIIDGRAAQRVARDRERER